MPVTQEGPLVTLSLPSGATAIVYLLGCNVFSWRTRDNKERLLQPDYWKTQLDGKTWIRGGIPICFPWKGFGPTDEQVRADPSLSIHTGYELKSGWAMNVLWDIVDKVDQLDKVSVRFAVARARYPERDPKTISLEYTVTLEDDKLTTSIDVVNDKMAKDYPLKCYFHPFFAVPDATKCSIRVQQGVSYVDELQGGGESTSDGADFLVTKPISRNYFGVTQPVTITNGGEQIMVSAEGFKDAAIYSPLPAEESRNITPEEWRRTILVQPGDFRDWTWLKGGARYSGSQIVEVHAPYAVFTGTNSVSVFLGKWR